METERIQISEKSRKFLFLHKKYVDNIDSMLRLMIFSAVLFHSAISVIKKLMHLLNMIKIKKMNLTKNY